MTQNPAQQHTVANVFTIAGIGMHSGAPAHLTVRPALQDTGIVFVRTDVTDRDNTIPARWNTVVDTKKTAWRSNMCTAITNAAGVEVSTVEHLFSAFNATGLDNAIIEIDGPEVPIMDGSARDFVAVIREAGLKQQAAKRKYVRILKPVTFTDGDREATLKPAAAPTYSFEIVFDNALVGRQSHKIVLDEKTFTRDIAPARTFGFMHEVEAMRAAGLARGGSLDNAVVVDGDKILNPGGLRFENEFARHKLLDAVGDVYLGGPVIGHYHGFKASHAMTNQLLRALFADETAFEITEIDAADGKERLRAAVTA